MKWQHKLTALATVTAAGGLVALAAVVATGRAAPERRLVLRTELSGIPDGRVALDLPPVAQAPVDRPLPERPTEPAADARADLARAAAGPGAVALARAGRCLTGAETPTDLEARRACVREQLGAVAPSAHDLARWLCAVPEARLSASCVLLEEVLQRVPPAQVLPYASEVGDTCPGAGTIEILTRAFAQGEHAAGLWFGAVAEGLRPADLFRGAGPGVALRLAEQLAAQGHPGARALLEEGATGLHGGSDGERVQAARLALGLQRDAWELRSLVGRMLDAPGTPAGDASGRMLAQALLPPGSATDSLDPEALALLDRLLDDRRFRAGAARALGALRDLEGPGTAGALLALRDRVLAIDPD